MYILCIVHVECSVKYECLIATDVTFWYSVIAYDLPINSLRRFCSKQNIVHVQFAIIMKIVNTAVVSYQV